MANLQHKNQGEHGGRVEKEEGRRRRGGRRGGRRVKGEGGRKGQGEGTEGK